MVQIPDFDALYRDDPDPWRVGSSFYEQRKLAIVLASLTQPRYAYAWDPGCGTGELAARLVERSERVLATDASVEAVRLATARCRELPSVEVGRLRQPGEPRGTGGSFDLMVLAEFAYYLSVSDRTDLWRTVDRAASATAEIVLVHWRHRPHDGFLSGRDVNDEAVRALTGRASTTGPWSALVHHDDRDFVLDVVRREAS